MQTPHPTQRQGGGSSKTGENWLPQSHLCPSLIEAAMQGAMRALVLAGSLYGKAVQCSLTGLQNPLHLNTPAWQVPP